MLNYLPDEVWINQVFDRQRYTVYFLCMCLSNETQFQIETVQGSPSKWVFCVMAILIFFGGTYFVIQGLQGTWLMSTEINGVSKVKMFWFFLCWFFLKKANTSIHLFKALNKYFERQNNVQPKVTILLFNFCGTVLGSFEGSPNRLHTALS